MVNGIHVPKIRSPRPKIRGYISVGTTASPAPKLSKSELTARMRNLIYNPKALRKERLSGRIF